MHICRDGEETGRTYERLITEAAAEGREVATFPVGGSDGVGALGYVAAARRSPGNSASWASPRRGWSPRTPAAGRPPGSSSERLISTG